MRKLISSYGTEVKVEEHIIVKNFWEFYLTKGTGDIRFGVVYGDEVEAGDVCMSEIKPFILTRTKDLSNIQPPPGWHWEE